MYKLKRFVGIELKEKNLMKDVEKFLNSLDRETTKVISVSSSHFSDFFEILVTYEER